MKINNRILIFILIFISSIVKGIDKKVLVVGSSYPYDDQIIQTIIDNINAIKGVTAVFMITDDFMNLTDFSIFDGALITELGDSSSMTRIADLEWPIPVVNLKGYTICKGEYPLLNLSPENFTTSPKSTDFLPDLDKLIVKNNNDILSYYGLGDTVQWTIGYNDDGAGEAHLQAFNILNSPSDEVTNNAIVLATSKYLEDNNVEPNGFLWKIEENAYTKRVVFWGIHHLFLQFATKDFYRILTNSVRWILKLDLELGLQNLEVDQGMLYPSFNYQQRNYKLAIDSTIDSVYIFPIGFNTTDTIIGGGYFSCIPGITQIKVISDFSDTLIYTIDISRNTNKAFLTDLNITNLSLYPPFNPDSNLYYVKVERWMEQINIIAEANDTNAILSGVGTFTNIPGTINVKITSEYGITNDYLIDVEYSPEPFLSSLSLDTGKMVPSFHPSIFNYHCYVSKDIDSIKISAATFDSTTIVSDTGYFSNIPVTAVLSAVSLDSQINKYSINIGYFESKADLGLLTFSDGNLNPEFNPQVTDYQLTISKVIDSLTVNAIPVLDSGKVHGDGVFKDIPKTIAIQVEYNKNTYKEYNVNIQYDLEILVVSENLPSEDLTINQIVDSINSIEGIHVIHMTLPEFNAVTDFTVYDAAIITANGPSVSLTALADQGWKIPVVNLYGYSIKRGINPLILVPNESIADNWAVSDKEADLPPGLDKLIVINNNDILNEYEKGEEVQWTLGYDDENGIFNAHVQIFDLSSSYNPEVANNSHMLATNKYLHEYILNPANYFLWKIENNAHTKRTVCWGLHHNLLQYATKDFYKILKNSLKWVVNYPQIQKAKLYNIIADNGTLYPSFRPWLSEYSLLLAKGVDSINFNVIKFRENDSISGDIHFSKIPGTAEIKVISGQGIEFNYNIHIFEYSAMPKLNSLNIDDFKLIPEFNPDTNSYFVVIPENISFANILALPEKQSISVTGDGSFPTDKGIAAIILESSEKFVNEYYIKFLHEEDISKLKTLVSNIGQIIPEFNPDSFNYNLVIPLGTEQVNLTGTADKTDAVVYGNGQIMSIPGDTVIMVQSPNGYILYYKIKIIFANEVSLSSDLISEVEIYPIPVNQELIIKTIPMANILITDITGRIVFENKCNADGKLIVNTSGFYKGVYLIKVIKNAKTIHLKILKN